MDGAEFSKLTPLAYVQEGRDMPVTLKAYADGTFQLDAAVDAALCQRTTDIDKILDTALEKVDHRREGWQQKQTYTHDVMLKHYVRAIKLQVKAWSLFYNIPAGATNQFAISLKQLLKELNVSETLQGELLGEWYHI